MIRKMTEQNTVQSFFVKYKKWFIALLGIQLIPVMLLTTLFGGGAIYLYVNNDINFHPYKSYIISGYNSGFADGSKNKIGRGASLSLTIFSSTPWDEYDTATKELKKKVLLEKQEYLAQFPESERGMKLAEMHTNNIKLPLQLEFDKRFKRGVDFYADYVEQRVKRKNFKSDKKHKEALESEAWKAGYEYGYAACFADYPKWYGLSSLKK